MSLKDWQALEAAGWTVAWIHNPDDPDHSHSELPDSGFDHTHGYSDELVPSVWNGKLWLGAAATHAAIETNEPDEAILMFERVTNQNIDNQGCRCCGPPHFLSFEKDDGKTHYFESRPSEYIRDWA